MPQIRNAEMVELLKADLIPYNDTVNVVWDLIGAHMVLPGLRCFWPMSGYNTTNVPALMNNRALTPGGVQMGYLGTYPSIPVAHFSGGTDTLYAIDSYILDVSGTETGLISSNRGISFGTWIRPTSVGGTIQCIMGKWDITGNDRSYQIRIDGSKNIQTYISSNGTNYAYASYTPSPAIANDEWHHVAMSWSPSAQNDEIAIFYDGIKTLGSAPGYASLHNSSANFSVGHSYSSGTPNNYYSGQVSMAWLSGCYLPDITIQQLYYRTRFAFQGGDIL